MDIRQLRYFAQIVESGSLSKASRSLFVAQPALSQQLAKLEDEVGKPLLQRSARGVTPTENGLALYHHARFMMRQLDQALSIARRETGDVHGMVSIGLPATTVAAIGVPLVRNVRANFPGILLNVVEGMSGQAAALPLILPTGTHGLRRRVAAEFEQRNLTAHIVAEIDSLSLLMNCVNDGMGATIKPMSALHSDGNPRRDWRVITVSDARLTRRNYLYSIGPDKLPPAAVAVAIELRETAQHLVVSGSWQGVTLVG